MKILAIALVLMSTKMVLSNGTDSTGHIVLNGTTIIGEIYPLTIKSHPQNSSRFVVNTKDMNPGFYHFIDMESQSNGAFFLLKGDSIEIMRNEKDRSITISWSDKALQAVFDTYEKQRIGQYYAWDGIDFVTPNKFEETYLKSHKNLLVRKGIIDSLSNTLTKDKILWLNKLAKINRLYGLLIPYNPCSPLPEKLSENSEINYQKEIAELVPILNRLTKEEILSFSYCLSSILVNYSRYVTRNLEDQVFKNRYESASIFQPHIKDMYLTLIILDKVNNQYVNTEFLNQYLKDCKNNLFKEKALASLSFKDRISRDSMILTTPLKTVNGSLNTWKDVLNNAVGAVVYVDLWASWCVGCKLNIAKTIAMKRQFPSLKVVFISKDKGESEWKRSIQSWGISDLGSHLRLDPDTELAKIITEPSIPRGIVIDKQGRIVTIDADEPNSTELNKLIESLL